MYGHYNPATGKMRCEEPAPLPEIKMMEDSELEALRKEVTMLQAALKALRLIDRQRKTDAMISEKPPTQMNEGESDNWTTDSRSASQWARDAGK
jgi:hypothetical protein